VLVLSRRIGQRLVFAVGGLTFTVEPVAYKNGAVKLGVVAPAAVKVFREELLDDPGKGGDEEKDDDPADRKD
jgi:carbon storage regulator CsrA